jgi:hypothetical protein
MYTNKQEIKIVEELSPIATHKLYERFNDFLDETYPATNIAGYNYSTSSALKLTDSIRYDCEFGNWLDTHVGDSLVNVDGFYFDLTEVEELLAGEEVDDDE